MPNNRLGENSQYKGMLSGQLTVKGKVFVTGNANKLKEVQTILSEGHPLAITSQNFDIPEIQGTTQDVARDKCRRAAQLVGGPCITEDTALCFDALNGLPGPYIKYFLKELGHDGLNALLAGFSTTSAYALCTFAYCAGPGSEPVLFEGRTDGKIVPPRGENKFGWDPVFEVAGTGKTYAEMTDPEKNIISHRYRALEKLRAYSRSLPPSN